MSYEEDRDNAKLCCIRWGRAYFTTQDVTEQWGDDWNDAPYEHNAGAPYKQCKDNWERGEEQWQIFEIPFDSGLVAPGDSGLNSKYSIQDINRGDVPWLQSPLWSKSEVQIMAGTTFKEFAIIINQAGGTVYVPYAMG